MLVHQQVGGGRNVMKIPTNPNYKICTYKNTQESDPGKKQSSDHPMQLSAEFKHKALFVKLF